MRVTAKDIAARVGLSQPTVSRILNDTPAYRVSPETRERVLAVAREMGYRPNAVAQSLRRRRTNIVGFYTGYGFLDARNDFLAEIIGGLQRYCDMRRLDLLLHGIYRGRSTDDIYGELVDGRIDGLFLHTSSDDPLVARLASSELHVVALADPLPNLPSVICDDADGIRQVIAYLWERGHRRIAYIAPTVRLASVERRVQAFRQCLTERGAPEEETPLLPIYFEEMDGVLDALAAHPVRPTAVCCWNDRAAYNLLRCCQESHVRVPEELAVVGFDGFLDMKLPARHLVTVAAPWGQVTCEATDVLIARIEGKEVAEETCLPVTLVAGDTA